MNRRNRTYLDFSCFLMKISGYLTISREENQELFPSCHPDIARSRSNSFQDQNKRFLIGIITGKTVE